jgi:AraC family transcriptional activator of pobA
MKHHSARFSNSRDDLELKGFKVYKIQSHGNIVQTYCGRDFYKVSLLSGRGVIQYSDKKVKIDGSVLVVAKPGVTISWRIKPVKANVGYICAFNPDFLNGECFQWIERSHLLSTLEVSVLDLSPKEDSFFRSLFQRMIQEQNIIYTFKGELIRNQINTFMHEALKKTSRKGFDHCTPARTNAAALYLELSEMQFPPKGQVIFQN